MIHSQLSRTWKNRYRPILPGLFYKEIRRTFVEKLSQLCHFSGVKKKLIDAISSELSFIKIKKETFGPF